MIAIITNPRAGSADEKTNSELREAITTLGLKHELFEDKDPSTAAMKAINSGHRHLCACGGDGTVAGVANGILRTGESGFRLSMVPMGTANLIATALGISADISEAVALCAESGTRRIDVGKIENEFFLLGLGIGATESFVTQTSTSAKRTLGGLAYFSGLLKSMRDPMFGVHIRGQSGDYSGEARAITLANFWGTERIELLDDSSETDGEMECLINRRLSTPTLLRLVLRGIFGSIHNDKDVDLLRGSRFVVTTTPSLPVQLDGNETDLVTPVEVEVMRQAIEVSVPRRNLSNKD